jgi:hemoglobin
MGGQDAIVKIADDTTANFLADERIKATFDNTNMDRFRKLLAEQFCQVAGGPCAYTGRNMAESHKGLHLDNADFNAVVEDLQKAMDKNGVPFATQNRFLARLAPMQHDIVTK